MTGKNPRVKGIKGVSILHAMIWFDIVNGIVPDYMHGVLLGVTKQVLGFYLEIWMLHSLLENTLKA